MTPHLHCQRCCCKASPVGGWRLFAGTDLHVPDLGLCKCSTFCSMFGLVQDWASMGLRYLQDCGVVHGFCPCLACMFFQKDEKSIHRLYRFSVFCHPLCFGPDTIFGYLYLE